MDPGKGIAEQVPDSTEIVHLHFIPKDIGQLKRPYVITMHGNTNAPMAFDRNTIFVSKNHASRFGSESYVYNGLDWDSYPRPDMSKQRTYYHFLGKAAWRVKNVRGAITTVKKTRKERLKVLGGYRFNIKMGMRFTFSPRIQFYGMVGDEVKAKVLNGSKGLLFPVLWNEPFGLAITESLFFGCPVFGTPYGSLPELVPNEVGFLSASASQLARALENAGSFSGKTCHEYALDSFNANVMALNYLKKYEVVLSGCYLNQHSPTLIKTQDTKFLKWVE
jgi:glycosyltransferase involved in cell wall biosynthesis